MNVTVNGEMRALPADATIATLIAELGFGRRRVAVELNYDVVSRNEYGQKRLVAGDVVEIVQFVGGG